MKVKGLIYNRSTFAEELLCKLNDSPVIHSINELWLGVNTANGQSMPYSGVVEVDIISPCFENKYLPVLMCVVPTNEYNEEVPVIICTYVICDLKEILSSAKKVSLEWETALDVVQSEKVGVERTTRKIALQPNDAKTITCPVR